MSSDSSSSFNALIGSLQGEAVHIAAELHRSELGSDDRLHVTAWNELGDALVQVRGRFVELVPVTHARALTMAREVREMLLEKGVSPEVLAASSDALHYVNEGLLKPSGFSISSLPGRRRRPPREDFQREV